MPKSYQYLIGAAKHAVSANNQNTTLLKIRPKNNDNVFILHDNRIFVFEHSLSNDIESGNSPSTSVDEQNVIMNIITSYAFRALGAIYILFRLFDNLAFLIVIILSIMNGKFTEPTAADISLFGVIGLEVFYDVLLTANKYWNLQRLSFCIGIILYILYFGIVVVKRDTGEFSHQQFLLTRTVLIVRFVSFILEEMVEIAIDCSIHNVLTDISNLGKETVEVSDLDDSSKVSILDRIPDLLKLNRLKLPGEITYKGSFFAWGIQPLATWQAPNPIECFSTWFILSLLVIPAIPTFFLLILVALLVGCAVLVAIILAVIYYILFSFVGGDKSDNVSLYDYVQEIVWQW